MILQSLYEYYQRKSALDADSIAPEGFEYKEIPFVIVIDRDGKFIDLQDTREAEGKKLRAKSYLVPKDVGRAGRKAVANLLWDNTEYVLGISLRGEEEEKVQKRHLAFCNLLTEVFGEKLIEPIDAILSFLSDANQKQKVQEHSEWKKVTVEKSTNCTFKILGDFGIIAEKQEVQEIVRKAVSSQSDQSIGLCLITGERQEIERLHPAIKGIKDAKSTGAKIVSFNERAYESYGYIEQQGLNAPVGKTAAFAYTTALNMLLGKDSKQRIQVGDTSTVFWAEKDTPFEDFFGDLITDSKDNPDRQVKAVEALYRSPQSGAKPITDENTKFYILGLAPNAARISVRFWHVTTVAEISGHIKQHFDDLEICRALHLSPYLSIFRLLSSIATQEDSKNIPPNLAGDTMKAIISGTPYPATLLQAAIRRNRATQDVSYARAALIKACLNRSNRYYHKSERELQMGLDPENTNIGYNLGRLFAVFEKVQYRAIQAKTVKNFFGGASSCPASAFPTLKRLNKYHMNKLEKDAKGAFYFYRALLEDIYANFNDPNNEPKILSLTDQGIFSVGYYHQLHALRYNPKAQEVDPLTEEENHAA